ncbi:MAG: radical SAM protein [Elusimicrobiota bacterium]
MSQKQRVALISPGTEQVFAVHEPINLGFLASYLEKTGYEVKIIDQLGGQNVEEELFKFNPDLAGITATTPVIYEAYKVAQLAKKMGILTVMGGIHATMFPQEALKYADIVVKGEGEKALVEILTKNIKNGIITGAAITKLDDIPPPARHLMLMKERYLYCKKRVPYIGHLPRVPANKRIIHMITSRGCPHARCIYCHNSTKNIPYRSNSPERVIEEIKLLKKQFDVEVIYFMEDNFFAEKNRVMKICELMIQNKLDYIDWGGTIRVEQVDEEMLSASKKAGAKWVGIGFESGSQRILDILSKGIKIEQSARAVEIVRKVGCYRTATQ